MRTGKDVMALAMEAVEFHNRLGCRVKGIRMGAAAFHLACGHPLGLDEPGHDMLFMGMPVTIDKDDPWIVEVIASTTRGE